tara:strand:+ start:478 stop:747 length:270 start_codon:yes stop_codon:yes gene_type:complete
MKKFPTPFQIYTEIDRNYRNGLTLTQIVEKTHPTFNINEYRKDGHRALIRETLVKTGFVDEIQFNKRTYKYVPTKKRVSIINKVLRRVA